MFNAKITVAGYFAVEFPAAAKISVSAEESAAVVVQVSPVPAAPAVFAVFDSMAVEQRYCHAA